VISIRFRKSISGNDYAFRRGDEVDWPVSDALSLIHAGIAQPADAEAKKAYAAYAQEQAKKPKAQPKPKPKPEPPREPEGENEGESTPNLHSDVPVTELDLDDTTIAALQAAGLQTAGQVAAYGDLTKLDGVGKATAAKINQALAKL
jgi:DNA-directed RNA polymerase alpha subunit